MSTAILPSRFLALVAKRLDVKPRGWQSACAPYGERGTRMSGAAVTDIQTLNEVREWKKAQKLAKAASSESSAGS